jgi:tetratricopeptide (TPR) repeat protein
VSKSVKLLKAYNLVNITFESSSDMPIKGSKSLFGLITRNLALPCVYNIESKIISTPETLNIIFVKNTKELRKYLNSKTLAEGFPDNILFCSVLTIENIQKASMTPRMDFFITEPFIAQVVQTDLLSAIRTKIIRTKSYLYQDTAQYLLQEGQVTGAMNYIKKIYVTKHTDSFTICLAARLLEKERKFSLALEFLEKSIDQKPNDYVIQTELYLFYCRFRKFDEADEILVNLFNSYKLDEDFLKLCVGNAIKNNNFNQIRDIVDYLINQDKEYRDELNHFIDVVLYIYIKHLILGNSGKLASSYLDYMIKTVVESSNSFFKLAEVAISENNSASRAIKRSFHGSKPHYKYYSLIDTLLFPERKTKSQIVSRCKELIDHEDLKISNVFELLLVTLSEINMKDDYEKYSAKFNELKSA